MTNFNNVTMAAGHVARKELRSIKGTKGDVSVLDLTIAINPETANENVQADFVRASVFGKLAETTDQYVNVGTGVGVLGSLSTGNGSYKDKNGVTQYPVHIDVESIDFSKEMSLNVNDQTLVGHLTNDPELAYTRNGVAVARFSIGVNRPKNGEEQKSDFFQVVAYGKQGEFVSQYFTKGMRIYVNGRISTGSYQNKQGFTVYTTEVVASRIKFAKKKANGTAQPAAYDQGIHGDPMGQQLPQGQPQYNQMPQAAYDDYVPQGQQPAPQQMQYQQPVAQQMPSQQPVTQQMPNQQPVAQQMPSQQPAPQQMQGQPPFNQGFDQLQDDNNDDFDLLPF